MCIHSANKRTSSNLLYFASRALALLTLIGSIAIPAGHALADIDAGLVAYYPFDGDTLDYSGNHNDGTPYGGPTFVAGAVGDALSLDGLDDRVDVPDSASFDPLGDTGTIAFFVKFDSSDQIPAVGACVIAKQRRSTHCSDISYKLLIHPDGSAGWILSDDSCNTIIDPDADLVDGVWHHLAVTWSGPVGKVRMYQDGVKVAEEDQIIGTLRDGPEPLRIGARYYDPFGGLVYIGGSVDEVRIYNRALFSCQIGELAGEGPCVLVDIRPWSKVNPVNPFALGVIPVAILGSDTFDVADVDVTTLRFGPSEAEPAHKKGGHMWDVNDDGLTDLLSHYRTQDTGIAVGDTEACVTGATLDGMPFEDCDFINTEPNCGNGYAAALVVPPVVWAGGRMRRRRRQTA